MSSGYYMVTRQMVGTTSAAIAHPTVTVTNGAQVLAFANDTSGYHQTTPGVAGLLSYTQSIVVQITDINCSCVWQNNVGTYPAGTTSSEVIITQLNGELFT